MFESILGAVLAHKQIVIAAIAITGIGVYAFPFGALNQAEADHLAVNIDREIEIPCLPYCNIANEPEDIDQSFGNVVHIRILFSFV